MGSFHNLKTHRKFLSQYTSIRTLQQNTVDSSSATITNTCPEGYDDDNGLAQHPLAQQYGLTNCADTLDTLTEYMGNADLLCLSIGVGLCNCTCAGTIVFPSTKLDSVPYLETEDLNDEGNEENAAAFDCNQVLSQDGENSKAAQLLPSYEGYDAGEWKCNELGDVGVVLWQVDPIKETITFASEFISSGGGAGIGISSNGGMLGADLLIVTKEEDSDSASGGEWLLKDMFSTGYSYDGSLVTLDDTQDAKLDWATEDDDRIAFVVTRPIKSCDTQTDLEILSGPVPFIWARFPTHGSDVVYHGPGKQSRGTVYLDLTSSDDDLQEGTAVTSSNQLPEDPEDLYTVDLRMQTTSGEHYMLPNGQVNTYACQSFELPSDQPYHMVSYESILDTAETPGLEDLNVVHHIVMYSCDADPHTTEPTECGSMAALCQVIELAWAVGMSPQYLPEVAGLPLKKFVLLEMHYENLSQQPNIMDGSGIRITITPQLRQYDFGYVIVGTDLGDSMPLEPGQEDIVRQGFCPTECLERNLPSTGVQIHGQFFHSHLQGRSLFTQHYLNSAAIDDDSPPTMLGDMPYYDFNHQSFKYYGNEPRLYPGDTLVTTCHYNTMDQSNPTSFGLETTEEMCFNIIGMYPKIDLKYCWNSTETGGWCTIPETEQDETGVYDNEGWKYVDSPLPSRSSLYVPGIDNSNGNTDTEGCVELAEDEIVSSTSQDEGGDSSTEDDPSETNKSSVVTAEDEEKSSSVIGIVVGVIVGALVVAAGIFLWCRSRGDHSATSAGSTTGAGTSPEQPLPTKHDDEEKGSSAMTAPGGTSSFMS